VVFALRTTRSSKATENIEDFGAIFRAEEAVSNACSEVIFCLSASVRLDGSPVPGKKLLSSTPFKMIAPGREPREAASPPKSSLLEPRSRFAGGSGLAILPAPADMDVGVAAGLNRVTTGSCSPAILAMSIESFPWTKEVEHYKALVTDVNLKSSLSGWEVAKQIGEMAAGFPIIYMTGASADQWTSHGVPDSILLRKPFAPTQLVVPDVSTHRMSGRL
jgi:hypothetical protein